MFTDWPAHIQASYFIGPYNLPYLLFSRKGALLCLHPNCLPNQSQTSFGIGGDRPMLTLYNIAWASTRKPYRIGLPLTHKDGWFRREFCKGVNQHCAELESGSSHIGLSHNNPWTDIAKLLNVSIEQAKRCTQDKIGFAALVDCVVANSTPW